MQPTQIDTVQASFQHVVPIADQAAENVSARPFDIAPPVSPCFKGDMFEGDMAGQGQKLKTTLGVVVNGLRDIQAIPPAAAAIAQRHVDHGIASEAYAPLGAAVIHSLETGPGDMFDNPTREDWLAADTLLSGAMINAAYDSAAE